MIGKAMQPTQLDNFAAMVDLSIRGANKVEISALLLSTRLGVMRAAAALPIEYPPALLFDPRSHVLKPVAQKGAR
jgi:hypothetical protein